MIFFVILIFIQFYILSTYPHFTIFSRFVVVVVVVVVFVVVVVVVVIVDFVVVVFFSCCSCLSLFLILNSPFT